MQLRQRPDATTLSHVLGAYRLPCYARHFADERHLAALERLIERGYDRCDFLLPQIPLARALPQMCDECPHHSAIATVTRS